MSEEGYTRMYARSEGATPIAGSVTDARPTRAAGLRVYPMGEEAMVYVPATGVAYALNRSALAIFDLCDGRRTVSEIGRDFVDTLDGAPDSLLPDVERGVSELREAGLVAYG